MKELPSEEIQKLLKSVVDECDAEDRSVRERQLRSWKKLKFYWDGFQRIWWNETAHDYRNFDQLNDATRDNGAAYYDKQINIFQSFLSSIIAALSVTVPGVVCFPDDAENPLDLSTAKAGNTIAELVYKHNDAQLLWIHALFIYCTEGLIGAYNYSKEDESYGTYNVHKYKDEEVDHQTPMCPLCNAQMGDPELVTNEQNEFDPDEDDVDSTDLLSGVQSICPSCLQQVDPEYQKSKLVVTRIVGTTTQAKSRQCIECYGGLFIKTALYAMKQADTPYLIYAYETSYGEVLDKYAHLRESYPNAGGITASSNTMSDSYERWARLSTQYRGVYPTNTITVRNCWLRPSSFNCLDIEQAKKLKELYPDGCKAVFVNDIFCSAENECLDDHWTLSYNPLTDYLQHEPLGAGLVSIQDIINDVTSLTLQTIEHGIPQTFADPAVLNFDAYGKTEATPGAIYPAKPSTGNKVGDAFYEVKTATLSNEVLPFSEKMQEAGQLVSGAFPALFGGVDASAGKTASGYAMQKSNALQRLGTTNKILSTWWKNIFGKVIPAYIKDVAEDERLVQKVDKNNFVNVFVRKAELQGKIGSVELETTDALPITLAQKKDVIMQLMNMNNPEIMQALIDPSNIEFVKQAIGLNEFNIPGEDDRQKQYEEIQQLLDSEPVPSAMPDQNGQPQMEPSVVIDPMLDNNPIHAMICKQWAISERGRQAKIENPKGYQNVLLHMQQHVQVQQAMQATSNQQPQNGNQAGQNETQPKLEKGPNRGNGIDPKQPSIN